MPPILQAAAVSGIPSGSVFCLGTRDVEVPLENGCKSWELLLEFGEYDWQRNQANDSPAQSRIAVYAMTSGTTGLPKAALISHRYVVAQTAMLEGRLGRASYQVAFMLHQFSPVSTC